MNDDLISREAVLELPRTITRNFFGKIVKESIDVDGIEALPHEDAVLVVRCGDCICHSTCRHEQFLGLNGFCSHGERKDK